MEYRREIDKKDYILSKIGKGTDFPTSQGKIVHEDGITVSKLEEDCKSVGIYDWWEIRNKIEINDKYIETKPFFNPHILLPNSPISPNTIKIEFFYGLTDKGDEFYRNGKWGYIKARNRKHWNETWGFYNKRAVLIIAIVTLIFNAVSIYYNIHEGNRIGKQVYITPKQLDSAMKVRNNTLSSDTLLKNKHK